ncbi:ABC transporter permease [Acaryochloris sp. IP29b_bin.137]|uniref:ABC transporter permease n=1 Tax=Acaryochloris sp. IP29b_bin.137 TaxID=2969217 RepID=UPI00262FB38E|nr:ABC transporter permease [Acaryochloris sp. IP29b_bin.137]
MLSYVFRRLLYIIPTILGVAVLIFVLFSVAAEDPVRVALGPHATQQSIADLEALWGLDKPLWQQFLVFLKQIVTFDFGVSYVTGDKLSDAFASGALVSLSLTLPPFVLGLVINISISMMIAYFRDTWIDKSATAIALFSMSFSYLVYIIALQYLLAFELDLFPIFGYAQGLDFIPYLALPWLIILLVSIGPDVRIYRTIFLNEMQANYVRTARAKGVRERSVLFVHILKNAMIPTLTFTVVALPFLILGAFLLERFFSIPGIGDLLITAINNGDFPVLKGMTMYITIFYSVFNLITDLLIAAVDPRVKLN